MSQLATLSKFTDPSQWDHTDFDVPIFMAHELWEVPHPWEAGKTIKIAILPGQEKPSEGTMLYAITEKDLKATADKINAAIESTGNAVKVFIGHSDPSKPQKDNPDVVGYGVGAKMGTFGPKAIPAVLAQRLCYVKGQYEEAKKYPERSPEFKPLTGQLTGLALLKTDPKLPMGMMTYQAADTVFYAAEFLKGKKDDKPTETAPEPIEHNAEQADEAQPEAEDTSHALPVDPTEPPSADELPPEHAEMAEKYMEHYKRNDPLMRYMCQKYESESAAASRPAPEPIEKNAMAGPANGALPGGEQTNTPEAGKEPTEAKPKEEDDMSAEKYAEVLGSINELTKTVKAQGAQIQAITKKNESLTVSYAEEHTGKLLIMAKQAGVKFDAAKEKARMLKLASKDERQEHYAHMLENYQRDERDPTAMPEIEIYQDGLVEADGDEFTGVSTQPSADEVISYCEEHKINPQDQRAFDAAVKALIAENKKLARAK